MTRLAAIASLLPPLALASAIPSFGYDALERAPAEIPVPHRPLEWGDVNILATSDTHGWLLGHQHNTWPEPNYSGDLGTFASFVEHMRDQADKRGVDLLLVDAGDHHDGSGLVSTSPASAEMADHIFGAVPYDILAIGNHELYKYESAKWIYDNRDFWGGRFLTSNVNITVEEDGETVSRVIGHQFAKFETTQGRKVTSFGVLFDFKAHAANLTIQSPSKMVKEQWFIDAIQEAPDFFALVGHMPARGETSEWKPLFNAIRRVHPHVPIFVHGGHTHVRDCAQYDGRSIAVVPGRYLETIAFVSSSMPPAENDDGADLVMNRRYLDANPVSYMWHTGKTEKDFDTPLGLNITAALGQLAEELDLFSFLGNAPHDYFLDRHPYGHPRNVLTLFAEKVLPVTVKDPNHSGPRIIIGNAGSLRFDLFKGRFDRNDELTVSPFTTAFLVTRLPARLAKLIEPEMNRAGASKLQPLSAREEDEAYVQRVFDEWRAEQWNDYINSVQADKNQAVFSSADGKPRTLGFVTRDRCAGNGDDIEHIPVPFSADRVDFIQTPFPVMDDDDILDVVVMDFAMDDFLTAVRVLDPERRMRPGDFKPYAEGTLINEVFGEYAAKMWR